MNRSTREHPKTKKHFIPQLYSTASYIPHYFLKTKNKEISPTKNPHPLFFLIKPRKSEKTKNKKQKKKNHLPRFYQEISNPFSIYPWTLDVHQKSLFIPLILFKNLPHTTPLFHYLPPIFHVAYVAQPSPLICLTSVPNWEFRTPVDPKRKLPLFVWNNIKLNKFTIEAVNAELSFPKVERFNLGQKQWSRNSNHIN